MTIYVQLPSCEYREPLLDHLRQSGYPVTSVLPDGGRRYKVTLSSPPADPQHFAATCSGAQCTLCHQHAVED